jgi:hypothetical protein
MGAYVYANIRVVGKDALWVDVDLQNCMASDPKILILIFAAPRTSDIGIRSYLTLL